MARITELRLRDVRCFEGEQSAKLGRITLLVGENGAGKSTFLGCYKALAKLANLDDLDDANHFDDAPFHMGRFDTIVRSGQVEFAVGGRFEGHCHTGATFTLATGRNATPVEREVRLEFNGSGNERQTLDIEWQREHDVLRITAPSFRFDLDRSEIPHARISTWLSRYVRHGFLPSHHIRDDKASFENFVSFFRSELPLPAEPSFAVVALDPNPPARARYYAAPPAHLSTSRNEGFGGYLANAGRVLGLWNDVSIRRDTDGDNIEVLIETPGGWRNLVDVGYGVHSLLPLLRAMHRRAPGTVFLLQQPEVHLHPSAQAGLAQFMAESNHAFVVETHSEHFTDRFRICVMEGTLRPEELSVVYFAPGPDGQSSQIHSLEADAAANLLNAPKHYRSFFLLETERLLGFRD